MRPRDVSIVWLVRSRSDRSNDFPFSGVSVISRLASRYGPNGLAILLMSVIPEGRWPCCSGLHWNAGRDARVKTMAVLRMILDPEGAAVDVDNAMLIGACATQLAAQLGYPLSD